MATKRQQYIKVYTNADKKLYQIIACTGGCTAEDAKELGISRKRLAQHIKQGNIKKDIEIKNRNKPSQYLYTFTEHGKKEVKEWCNCWNLYKRAGVGHDCALRQAMIKEMQREDVKIERFITEKDWKHMLDQKIYELKTSNNEEERERGLELERMQEDKQLSPVDSGYVTSEGEYVAIEVVTRNYSDTEIEQKHNFVKAMGITSYKEIRA